ncbi:MAG: NrsF family protein [Alphaproteobacteria bacterium]
MDEQNLDKLIDGLTGELEPVKPLAHPFLRILPFFVVSILYVAALVFLVGLRPDIGDKFSDPAWMFETFLMGFTAISAGIAATFLCVPDACGKKWMIAPPLTALGIFAVWSAFRAISEGLHMPQLHMDHCMGEGVFMAAIPMTMLLFMIRRGATTKPGLSCLMNITAAGALGYIGLRFTCMMDTVGHATVSHLIPYLLIGAAMGIAARKLYKW